MANTTTIKIEDGVIVLPKKLQKAWKGAKVFIESFDDTISIKRLTKPALSFEEMIDEFQQVARRTKLSKKDVEKTIREVRKEIYK